MKRAEARFVLDHDVDANVATMLRSHGYTCWTVAAAGLNEATDDVLTAYAHTKRAILVTHDKEFSQRRARNVVGRHVQLRCPEWEACDLMERLLEEIVHPA